MICFAMYFITRKDYKRNGSFVRVCGVFLPYCNNVMRKKHIYIERWKVTVASARGDESPQEK